MIFTKINTYIRMSPQKKILVAMSFVLCLVARVSIYIFSHRQLERYYGKSCRMCAASVLITSVQYAKIHEIRRAIQLVVRVSPWHLSCLAQAMAAKFWCQWYSIPYVFFIGFPKQSDKPLGAEAHAWVMAGKVVITGGDSFDTHQVILSYSNIL